MACFSVDLFNRHVEVLTLDDAPRLQLLFEACSDYAMLESGEPPKADAARVEFLSTPPGRTVADKFMFGLVNGQGGVVGLLSADRGWPDHDCWWIGLLLIAPEERGRGAARAFVEAFLNWLKPQGAKRVELAFFEENQRAEQFWRACGFERIRSTEPRIIGLKTHVLHVMRRSLQQENEPANWMQMSESNQ